jgi:hypothetical protein
MLKRLGEGVGRLEGIVSQLWTVFDGIKLVDYHEGKARV